LKIKQKYCAFHCAGAGSIKISKTDLKRWQNKKNRGNPVWQEEKRDRGDFLIKTANDITKEQHQNAKMTKKLPQKPDTGLN
jgi:hypothetical protein